ncbi:MAG: putative Ig domain-containing protein, partial [Bryobacteraceae bacterium]
MLFNLRRAFGGLVLLCSAASAQIVCSTTLGSTGQPSPLRGRAQSDLVADFFLSCEGSAPSNGIIGSVTVTLNTPITSRITSTFNNASEALLLINEPSPQDQLGQPIGANIPGANVLQGVQTSGNSVQFSGVPLMPDNVTGFQRQIFRIVNLRANASLLGNGASITATVSINAPVPIVLNNAQQIVGTVGAGLDFSLRAANDLAGYSASIDACLGNNTTLTPQTERDFIVKFTESFANDFRERNIASSLANPTVVADQNNLGSILGSGTESGFVNRSFPSVSGMNQAGQATAGTRLVARFTGIPSTAQLWVTVQPVLQGTSGTGITAALTATSDASGDGAFNRVNPSLGPYVRLDVSGGVAQAVWEVFDANQVALESLAFGVVLSIPAASTVNGSVAVNAAYGPAGATLTSATAARPYFAPETTAGRVAAEVRACVPQLTITSGCPLTPGSVGIGYSQTLTAAGGTLPYSWSLLSGSLPPGLQLAGNGVVAGTPTQAGTSNFALRLADAAGAVVARECSIDIRATLSITTSCPLPDASQGQPYSAALTADGGTPPFTWQIARGALPGGIALSPGGQIAGAPSSAGSASFALRVTDSRALSAEKECALRVLAPFRLSPSSMLFRAPSGGEPVAPQIVHLVAEPSGQSWDVRVSTFGGGEWLRATPANGRVPGVIEVTADTTGVAPGSYEGSVTVLTRGSIQQSFGVGVRLEVTAARPPKLTAEPAGVLVAVPAATSRADRIVTIANRGSGSLPIAATLTVSSGQGWIDAPSLSGSLGPGGSMQLPLRIAPGALEPGVYRANLRIRNQNPNSEEAVDVPVTLAVSASREAILVEPSNIGFDAVAGLAAPDPVRVSIGAPGESSAGWEARVEPSASDQLVQARNWLSLDTPSGRASSGSPSQLELRVNPQGLAPGRYRGEVTVVSTSGVNSPRTILVSLNVRAPGSLAAPSIEPSALVVGARSDGAVPRGAITIRNPLTTPLDVDFRLAVDSILWNVTAPSGRTVPPGGQIQLDVTADPSRLPTNVSRATLFIQTSSDSLVHPVDLLWVPSTAGRAASPGSENVRQIDAVCPPGGIVLASASVPYGFRASAAAGIPVMLAAYERSGARFETGAISASLGGASSALRMLSPGSWAATVPVPDGLEGAAVLSFYAEDRARGINGCLSLPVTIDASPTPVLPPGAVLSTASFAPYRPLAAGGIIALFGSRLASGRTSATLPLPTDLNGTSVRIGGTPVPLFFAADLGAFSQVNGVVPYTIAPNLAHQVVVNGPTGSASG